MKKLLMVLLMVLITAPALGQESSPREKFYNFGETMIDGTRKVPPVIWVEGVKRPEFESLLDLKKSFMDEIEESSKERVLR